MWLITHGDSSVEVDEIELEKWIAKREKNIPLEYISHVVDFYGYEFYIDDGALIPRPETELLIDKVLEYADKNREYKVVEVGVGSAIISVILALKLPHIKIDAIDISSKALHVARKNIVKFNLEDRVTLIEGDLLSGYESEIEILVSNPPYIAKDFKLDKNVLFEPHNALFGGDVGDELIRKLLLHVRDKKIPFFACEMGYDQKDKILEFLEFNSSIEFYKDYSGYNRGFTIQ